MNAIDKSFRVPVESGPPVPLPAWTYINSEFLALEREHLLLPSWQIVCHRNELPEPGDYTTLSFLDENVIVIRGKDHRLHAFHNVCRHRGARLLCGSGRCNGLIACPYHGWAYDFDGSLRGVPQQETFPGLDKSRFGLKSVDLEEFHGFVFIRLKNDGGPGVADMWAPFESELAPYRLDEMQPFEPRSEEIWECDWKVAVDNNLESYHVPVGHPGLYRMFTPDYLDSRVEETGVSRGFSHFRDKPSKRWSERLYQQHIPEVADHLPEEKRRTWAFYTMLPNIGIDIYPDSMDFFQLLPVSRERCVARYGIYALPDSRREMKVLRRLNARISGQVTKEDKELSRRVQEGIRSSAYEPGPLSAHEVSIRQFHALIRHRLPVAGLSEAPPAGSVAERNAELLAKRKLTGR